MECVLSLNPPVTQNHPHKQTKQSFGFNIIHKGQALIEFSLFAFMITSIIIYTLKTHQKLKDKHINVLKETKQQWGQLEKEFGNK